MTPEEALAEIERLKKEAETHDRAIEVLEAKKSELLNEVKTERSKRREAETRVDELDRDLTDEKTNRASGEGWDEAKKALEERHTRELPKANQRGDDAEARVRKLVIGVGIDHALDEAGVSPQYKEMLRLSFESKHQIKLDDQDTPVIEGRAMSDVLKEWTNTDAVKSLKAAGAGSGSGAPGGRKSEGLSLKDMSEEQRMELARTDPMKFRQLSSGA